MADFTRFYFVSAGPPTAHLAGWDPAAGEWTIPCGRVAFSDVTIFTVPTEPLCLTCIDITSDPSLAPRTHR